MGAPTELEAICSGHAGFEVESSRDSEGLAARPLGFNLGTTDGPGSVPPGLDECIRGMHVVRRDVGGRHDRLERSWPIVSFSMYARGRATSSSCRLLALVLVVWHILLVYKKTNGNTDGESKF